MQEKRYILLNHPNGCRDSYIKPGSSKKFTVEIPSYEGRKQHFLRLDHCISDRIDSALSGHAPQLQGRSGV